MPAAPVVELTRDPIDFGALTEEVRSNQAGAVLLFLGTVREMTAGRRTLALEYDAYAEMAVAEIHRLIEETSRRWTLQRVGVVHRLGRLELGEVSIAIAVSAAHRDVAFDAGRHLIDRLKETVPIWKRENWSDGTTEWVHPGGG